MGPEVREKRAMGPETVAAVPGVGGPPGKRVQAVALPGIQINPEI